MAAPTNVALILSMVDSKISIETSEAAYVGTVNKLTDKHKVILDKVSCINPATGNPVPLACQVRIMTNEIINYECLSLPRVPQPISPKPLTDDTRPLAELLMSLNDQHRKPQPHQSSKPNQHPINQVKEQPVIVRPFSNERCPELRPINDRIVDVDCTDEWATSLVDTRSIPFDDYGIQDGEENNKRPKRYVIVNKLKDGLFDEAISLIKERRVIGLNMDGINLGRHGQLCLIAISIVEFVFVFDIQTLNPIDQAFDKGFKDIFESKGILKIIHDCRSISDILRHQYDTVLQNVYDTQVADIMILRWKNNGVLPNNARSLNVVLNDYLQLSQPEIAFYQIRKSSFERNNQIWRERPMSSMLLQSAALSVRYFAELRLSTLEWLLADFTDGVNIYLDVRDAKSITKPMFNNDTRISDEFLRFGPMKGCNNGRRSGQNEHQTLDEIIGNLTVAENMNTTNGCVKPARSSALRKSTNEIVDNLKSSKRLSSPNEAAAVTSIATVSTSSISSRTLSNPVNSPNGNAIPVGMDLQRFYETKKRLRAEKEALLNSQGNF